MLNTLDSKKRIRVPAGSGEVLASAFTDSTEAVLTCQTERLRSRFAQDGYLFLRGLIPQQEVLQVTLEPSGVPRMLYLW